MEWGLLDKDDILDDMERTVEFINISDLDEADEYVARLSYDFEDENVEK